MANVPTRMNRNMAPNQTGKTLCLCSPSIISVETGTATNSGPLPIVNTSWGYVLATIPKLMDSCSIYQPLKNWWDQKSTTWNRLCHMSPSLVIHIMELFVSTYIIPPPMPPARCPTKNKNWYTLKKYARISEEESTSKILGRCWTRHYSNSTQPWYRASRAKIYNQHQYLDTR